MNIRKTILQTIFIVIASILLGFTNNIVNPNRVLISFDRPQAPAASDSTFETEEPITVDGPVVLSKEQLSTLIQKQNVIIIDARTPAEFQSGHIPGAINIPFDLLSQHIEQIDAFEREKWLVPYCDGPPCEKSMELATLLFDMGFMRVAYYEAGLDDWKKTEEVAF